MTQAIRFHETGGPDVLKFEDVEVGNPCEGEVRVRVEAIGLNRAEVMFRYGEYLEDPKLPAGLGYEGAGVVEAVGSGVDGIAEGDEVSVMPAFSMNDYHFYAEQAVVPAYAVTPRPNGLDAVQASAVWMPYLTAYGALVDIGGLSKGEAVLIPAASSSVGLAAIQIANHIGAISIAATRTAAKADALRKAGAAYVIVTEEQDLAAEVMRITGDAGARLAFDPVAGPMVDTLANAMGPGGTIFEYGALSGDATPFPLFAALGKGLSVRGYTLFEVIGDAERLERAKGFIYEGVEAGDLVPTVDRTFDFAEMVDAHRYMESNQQLGKIVVTVG
ncbi:zinc-dependent alcohol dehydrogenase family protein [Endozoicomonas sp. G2_2]|uniref:zinc-dependent alcohol dehydrogenase family protein n=1 Tax=Endozoicomonas sp. G2_2 TaxID=2821092 RepID=UPI001ADB5479|nr:zinc-dependent alcohol dehydrogenase family protein [Endozoicomonas sp. G2_2]MBO9468881.1 zinc-dependent alcohol dehydrogenase family protein [Endozoicomonas sp. G2_2]